MDTGNWFLPLFSLKQLNPLEHLDCIRATRSEPLDLQVLQSKAICTDNVHGGKACPKGAFTDTLKEDSASNIVALGYHI
eukprot:33240-Pelagomonas_calceolata.AAC.1